MILYGLKTCDTCRKARKALNGVQFMDVREDGVPSEVLRVALDRFGDKLLNTRSTTWRDLPEAERGRAPLDLLAIHPTLMKRPLIVSGETMILGWDKAAQQAAEAL
ncbi:ArsC/Spx/MgsR family protein [Tropicibacter sp. S64]|uniref:ArsC/Spx/MgsR family protein n=1 Tax=Tropicibacter sp. S64 TaxID=3415122 RepID=UPI003C7CB0B3